MDTANKNYDDKIALIILSAVKNLNVGKNKLAAFLGGSKSKIVAPVSDQQIYGGLLWHDIPTITNFIDQLEAMDFIRTRVIEGAKYSYPILELTGAGAKALKDKLKIPLQITKFKKPVTVGDSEEETLQLFRSGKIAAEIASARQLAVSTIYSHFYRLIYNNRLNASDVVSAEVISLIEEARKKVNALLSLKELKALLPETVSYEEIRCVLAMHDKNQNDKK